ncbi:MAG TPA: hypothetical protein VFA26_04910, partial [Gemmataceae bacterium]|nr:hypothetical protein [Gemmataceae bacterium]
NNQLNVIPLLRDGKQFAMVTADGEHLVSVETMDEVPGHLPGTGHAPMVQAPAHPPKVQTLKPTCIPPTLTAPAPSSKLTPVPARTPGGPSHSLLPPTGPEPPEIDPLAPPTTTPVPPGRTTTQAMGLARQPAVIQPTLPAPPTASPPRATTQATGVPTQKTLPLALPAIPPVPQSLSRPAPASPFAPVTPRWTTPPTSAAPVKLSAPRTAVPADKKKDQAGAYVSTGTVTFASAETGEPPTSGRATPEQVKERVQSVCGGAASGVEVSQQGDNVLLIKMRVPSSEEGHRLHKKIAELPELAGYDDWKINMVIEPRK